MKLLAPAVITLLFSMFLYGTKLVYGKEEYDQVKQFVARNEQIKKQGKAHAAQADVVMGVVQQFQQQSAYGPDIGRMAATSQYTLIKP